MPEFAPMSTRLQTARLTLRPWTEDDIEEYRALVAERGDEKPSVETARERIATQLAATQRTGLALLPIWRRVEGDFIGYCGLTVGRSNSAEPEIAYELRQRAHGHGYATEAATAVLAAATATGRRRLWATVGSWNAPSLRVLDKLGFHHDADREPGLGRDGREFVWLTRALP
jgi:RimJ/RimL family protein N-acetyltransferase